MPRLQGEFVLDGAFSLLVGGDALRGDDMDFTFDAFMAQLGEAAKVDSEASANSLMKVAEAIVKRAKKDYGLSVDAAQYVIKDWTCDISKKGAPDAKGADRFVQSYISTIAKDRDSEAILPESVMMEDYRELPIVLRSHLYSEMGIGSNQWIVLNANEKGAVEHIHSILASTQFASKKANPLADQLYNWSIEEMPIGDSIGFIPVDFVEPHDKGWDKIYDSWVKRTTAFLALKGREATADLLEGLKRIYTKVIMLEYSKVMIPSNPFAVSLAVEKGLILDSQIEAYTIPDQKELPGDDATVVDVDSEDFKNAVDVAVESGLIDKNSPGISIMRPDEIDDTEEKEGRRFSAATLKALDAVRVASQASTEANDGILKALDDLFDTSDVDDIDEETKELDEVVELEPDEDSDITPEIAKYLLKLDADEKKAVDKPMKLTATEKVLARLGHEI